MQPQQYSDEQIADVKIRVEKAIVFLKELELQLAAQMLPQNMGDNVFGLRLIPFLQDTKFIPKPDTSEPEAPKITDVKAEPTVSPFVPQAPTDENNTDSKTA
jgi:hypothetical protein